MRHIDSYELHRKARRWRARLAGVLLRRALLLARSRLRFRQEPPALNPAAR